VKTISPAILVLAMLGAAHPASSQPASSQPASSQPASESPESGTLAEAQRHFYSGRYETAAALAMDARTVDAENLAASELRSSALLFEIKRTFGEPKDKNKAWKACAVCQELMAVFVEETTLGRTLAKARLATHPADEEALFFLGKLNLNYIWLHLGPLGRRTGWGEYWEARKSLDAVLKTNPDHVRARVARAWIDYIVDTRVPWGTKWLLGGGSKGRGLRTVEEAAASDAEPFAQAEAKFALWDMQVRERNLTGAIETARTLSREFPDNRELVKFLDTHATTAMSRPQR
jgi:hypothetical protein